MPPKTANIASSCFAHQQKIELFGIMSEKPTRKTFFFSPEGCPSSETHHFDFICDLLTWNLFVVRVYGNRRRLWGGGGGGGGHQGQNLVLLFCSPIL